MPRFEYKESYDIGPAIFSNSDHHHPYSITVNPWDVTANAKGEKVLPGGQFVVEIGDVQRFLPRAKTTSAFTSGSKTGGALLDRFQLFKPGDQLWVLQSYGKVTLAGTWQATDSITLTIGTDTLTFMAGDTVRSNIADNIVEEINDDPAFSNLVEAVAVGDVVWLLARDWSKQHALNATTTSGAGTITRSAATFAAPEKIGAIESIIPASGGIVLVDNAAVSVPAGVRVGVRVNKIFGIYSHSIDMATGPKEVNACNEGEVYERSIPYLDDDIKRQLPQLVFGTRF